MGTQGNIEAILKVKPDIVIGVPGYLYHLVRSAKQMNKDFSFIKKVILGASAVPPGFKEKLSGMLTEMSAVGVQVFGTLRFYRGQMRLGRMSYGYRGLQRLPQLSG